jgi:hypothetical protein
VFALVRERLVVIWKRTWSGVASESYFFSSFDTEMVQPALVRTEKELALRADYRRRAKKSHAARAAKGRTANRSSGARRYLRIGRWGVRTGRSLTLDFKISFTWRRIQSCSRGVVFSRWSARFMSRCARIFARFRSRRARICELENK